MEERTVTYFAEPGPQNTDTTLSLVSHHAQHLAIRHVVIASDTGKTARKALEVLGNQVQLVVVTNPANLRFPVAKLHDYLPRFREHKQALLEKGLSHVPCSLSEEAVRSLQQDGALVSRIDWKRFQTFTRVGVNAIDRIGVGVRVGLTIATWARIHGDVPAGSDVIAVAGTGFGGGGADTAIVVRTAEAWKDFRVLETLARPRVSPPSEV
jgi:hypothetical protein